MKQKSLLKTMLLLFALIAGVSGSWGQEQVYKSLTFPDDNSSNNGLTSNQYQSTWTAKSGTFEWSITNFNNNNWNQWKYIKCGRKNAASVATIITSAAIDKAITKVVVTIDALTASKVNSIKLYTSSNNSSWTEAGSFSKATGEQTVTLASAATNLYYKVEFDCASGSSNGLVQVSKVEYYYSESGQSTLEANDLALENAPVALSFDLYNKSAAQTISYTTSSTGVVTVSENAYVTTTVDATNKTITVTPIAVTPSEQTITVSQAADDTYAAGQVTFTVNITNSDPNANDGSAEKPYTVAEARAAIDAGTGVTDVYATGIVSEIVTAYSSDYSNVTFDIVDEAGASASLRAYHCGGTEAANVAVGDVVVVSGNLTKYNDIYEFAQDCQIVSLTHSTKPIINADNVEIEYDATSGEIPYDITNPVDDVSLTATTTAEWISNVTVVSDKVTFTTTANEENADRTATITLSYEGATDKNVTVTQKHYVIDFATLPFEWAGGAKAGLLALTGVTANGLGSDYAESNAPYRIKFDTDGDYIQVKTDSQPAMVTVDVKMIGGATTSKITVQESSDGTTFTDVQVLTISGTQNTELSLETNETFSTDTRYVRLLFTRGSNVGVGSITITKATNDPSISLSTSTIEAPASETVGTITVTYNNIASVDAEVLFFESDGVTTTESTEYSWLLAEINNDNNIDYIIEDSDGEARTAYMKVHQKNTEVYSPLITITQAKYVIDYATLPFEFNSGKAAIGNTAGLTQSGLGSDYNTENSKLKFDDTGVYLVLKINEAPGALTFDIKGNSFSGGTFTVQSSADGNNYTDLVSYTDLSGTEETKLISGIGSDVRYIKWIYTNKVSGNVGLGNIKLEKVPEYATVSISPAQYATYSSAYPLDFTYSDVEAYIVTSKSGDKAVTLEQVTTVPAETGLLLKAAENVSETTTFNIPVIAASEATSISTNYLHAHLIAGVPSESDYYILADGEDGVCFYKSTGGDLAANRAYLVMPTSGAPSLSFDFGGGTTGLSEELRVNSKESICYDLSGRRVAQPTKGLYIVNGKKVLVP